MTNHIDIYKSIHKAIRYVLFELSIDIGKHNVSEQAQMPALSERIEELGELLNEHAHTEDHFFHLLLKKQFHDIYVALEEQHKSTDTLWLEVTKKGALVMAPGQVPNAKDWHQFYLAFNAFVESYLAHIYFEETVALPLLWKVSSPQELIGKIMDMLKGFSKKTHARSKKYCLLSCNDVELKEMGYR